jgi:hydroxymethylbilane synthase
MPSLLPDGFELIAFTDREKSEDVLVSHNSNLRIEDKSKKIIIGTSSVRRRALLCLYYPHVETVDIRGNLQTRIKKMKDGLCDGIMLAYAGVHRMNLESLIVQSFPKNTFVPPVGQGCIAIEAASTLSIKKRDSIRACLNNPDSEACLLAERAFLRRLEGGCSIPAFGLATLDGDTISLSGGLVSLDGQKSITSIRTGSRSEAAAIGEDLGNYILSSGGRELLAEIRSQQD